MRRAAWLLLGLFGCSEGVGIHRAEVPPVEVDAGFGVDASASCLEGAPCDDHSACTKNDRCSGGACVGEVVVCDDGIDCTADICDPGQGCLAMPVDSRCPSAGVCQNSVCTPAGCEVHPAPDGQACGPVQACDTAQLCLAQQCVEIPVPLGQLAPLSETTMIGPLRGAGTFVRSGTTTFLYLGAERRSRGIFKIVEIDGHQGRTLGEVASLEDQALLHPLRPGVHIGVHTSSLAKAIVTTVDTSDPRHPRPIASALAGYFPSKAATVVGTKLYFCGCPQGSRSCVITSVEAADPAHLGPVITGDYCAIGPNLSLAKYAAGGELFVSFDTGSPDLSLRIVRLGQGLVLDHRGPGITPDFWGEPDDGPLTDGHLVVANFGYNVHHGDSHLEGVDIGIVDADALQPELVTVTLSQDEFCPVPGMHNAAGIRPLALLDRVLVVQCGPWLLEEIDLADPRHPRLLPDKVRVIEGNTRLKLHSVAIQQDLLAIDDGVSVHLLQRTPSGLLDAEMVVGSGWIEALRESPSGPVALSRMGGALIADPAVPPTIRRRYDQPTPFGFTNVLGSPAGYFAASAVEPMSGCPFVTNASCSQHGLVPTLRSQATIGNFGSLELEPDGTSHWVGAILWGDVDAQLRIAIDRCLGLALVQDVDRPEILVVDRCSNPEPHDLDVVARLDTLFPTPGDFRRRLSFTNESQVVLHGQFATIYGGYTALLVDLRVPSSPQLISQAYLQDPREHLRGASFDGQHWLLLSWGEDGRSWISVREPVAGGPETLRMPVVGGMPARGVFAAVWPKAYVGASLDAEGANNLLLSFDLLSQRLIDQQPLPSTAIDLLVRDHTIWVAREDGLSVFRDCGP